MFTQSQLQDMFEAVDSMAEFGRQNPHAIQPETEPDAYLETCKEVAGYEQIGNQIEAVIEMGNTVKGKWIYVSETDEATIRGLIALSPNRSKVGEAATSVDEIENLLNLEV